MLRRPQNINQILTINDWAKNITLENSLINEKNFYRIFTYYLNFSFLKLKLLKKQ